MTAQADRFGFLPLDRAIHFDCGYIEPVADLAAQIEIVKEFIHEDHIAPPQDSTGSPARLYRVPTSHAVSLAAAPVGVDFRSGAGAFLMHFFGHLFCHRLQFEGWWLDGRLPMQGRRWSYLPENKEGDLVSAAYRTWREWPEKERTRFTNLLYMHVRSFSYEWDWERFTLRYMVFDGCYRMARALGHLSKDVPHGKRLGAMFSFFGMTTDGDRVTEIADLRNGLFHETLWDAGQPGAGTRKGIRHADNLWRINDRLLFALAGYSGNYLKVDWRNIGLALI